MNRYYPQNKQGWLWGAALVMMLMLFVCLSIGSSLRESLVYDEPVHLKEGMTILRSRQFLYDTYNPQLATELLSLPLFLGMGRHSANDQTNRTVFPARLVSVAFGILLIAMVAIECKRRYGDISGLVVAALLSVHPVLLAHSHYVNLDVIFTTFFIASVLLFFHMLERMTWSRAVAFGMIAGCAIASKITGLPYILLTMIGMVILERKIRILFSKEIAVASCIVVFVLWASYGFSSDVIVRNRIEGNAGRVSTRILETQGNKKSSPITLVMRGLMTVPVPLGQYIADWKNVVFRRFYPSNTLAWGQIFRSVPPWVTIVTYVIKIPIPFLLLSVIALALLWKAHRWTDIRMTLVPIGAILCVLLPSGEQPAVRYGLPIIVCIAIAIGAATEEIRHARYGILLISFLLFWSVWISFAIYPHYLSYSNELISKTDAYQKLHDSNIDWGQTLPAIQSYIQKHPDTKFRISYFGTDNGDLYGLKSDIPYDTYKADRICAFHVITPKGTKKQSATLITISNWNACGYRELDQYTFSKVKEVVGDAVLVF
jgi:hypothetical protein